MKRYLSLLLSIIVSALSLSSCIFLGPSVKGNGHVVKETRHISGFDKIEASTGLEVSLVPDSTEFVLVEADENLHEVIETELRHETLSIYSRERIRHAEAKKVFVHFIKLEKIQSSSGSMVRSQNIVTSNTIEVSASSGSQQFLEINAENFKGKCSSGAQIFLSGKADNANVRASSGAQFKAEDFITNDCMADVSSGAHIWIGVKDHFNGEASSGGHIYYSGDPERTDTKTSSGGSINRN